MLYRDCLDSKCHSRFFRAVGLAAVLMGASGLGADAATRIGWVLGDQPDAVATYTPSLSYTYSSTIGDVSITPVGVGYYQVDFAGLRNTLTDNVLVTAHETNGYCQPASWGAVPGAQEVFVRCFDAAGAPANQQFFLVYQAQSGTSGTSSRGTAFLWADDPASASYTPNLLYQYNSTGASNTVARSGPGAYTAHLPGLTKVGGHVQVSAYGWTAARCKVLSWGADVTGTDVEVRCFDASGAAADNKFTLEYSRRLPTAFLTSTTTKGAYAWASRPSIASYTTSGPYSYNGMSVGKLTANQLGKGDYTVTIPGAFTYSRSSVLVTAFGSDSSYCNSTDLPSLHVVCFSQGGAPVNSRFDLSFQAHP